MEYEFTALTLSLLIVAGVFAGFINTLAGGGSLLTLPALMLLGMPADVANGTNRVAVLIQSLEATRGFNRYGMLSRQSVLAILAPSLVGALVGALVASYLPPSILEPVMLVTLVSMGAIMVLSPSTISPPPGTTPKSPGNSLPGMLGLFAAGLYGGFIQAGVGFVLLVVLCGALRYDLVRANALKMVGTVIFSIMALAVFISRGQVLWVPGLVLAAANVVGVHLSVRFAVSASQRVLRWFLLVMVILVCLAAWLR
jgi:hypothetical protein